MAGRIGIDDVAPVVSAGRYPAKAVVGEVVPVKATVWREGHDAVSATLVVRFHGTHYPQITEGPAQNPAAPAVPIEAVVTPATKVKPQAIPMGTGRTPDVFHGVFTPDRVGLWTFRVDGWGDPLATWRKAVTASGRIRSTTRAARTAAAATTTAPHRRGARRRPGAQR